MIIILVAIYIISIIGAILVIRYEQALFNRDSGTTFFIFCPLVNSSLCIMKILTIILPYLDKKLYNLITYRFHKRK